MTRATLRTILVLTAATGLGACGPDPEPQTAATPPPPPTATAPATVEPPPPAEPTAEQRKATARAALDAKDYAKAKGELEAVVAKDANDVEAWKMLAEASNGLGDRARATDALLAAARADGGKDQILALAAGRALYDQRRYEDLVGLMQTVTQADPKSTPALMYLALGQNGKSDWAGAEATYRKLTELEPDEPQHWAQLANVQAASGKADDAKATAKKALDAWTEARKPKTTKEIKLGKGAEEIALIARAYRRAGDPKAAQSALDKYVVPKDETAPLLEVERGLAKLAAKDTKGAEKHALNAVKAGGEGYAPARLLLAGIAAAQKKPDDAKAQLDAWSKLTTDPSAFAWEKQWVEGLIAGGGAAPAPKK